MGFEEGTGRVSANCPAKNVDVNRLYEKIYTHSISLYILYEFQYVLNTL